MGCLDGRGGKEGTGWTVGRGGKEGVGADRNGEAGSAASVTDGGDATTNSTQTILTITAKPPFDLCPLVIILTPPIYLPYAPGFTAWAAGGEMKPVDDHPCCKTTAAATHPTVSIIQGEGNKHVQGSIKKFLELVPIKSRRTSPHKVEK